MGDSLLKRGKGAFTVVPNLGSLLESLESIVDVLMFVPSYPRFLGSVEQGTV